MGFAIQIVLVVFAVFCGLFWASSEGHAPRVSDVLEWVRVNPFYALASTNSALIFLLLWVASEGHPFRWIYRKLFQSAFALVPASVLTAQLEEVRADVEKSVIGDSVDGGAMTEMPEKGLSTDQVISLLDVAAAKDDPHWKSGKVSGTVYHGGSDIVDVSAHAFRRFALSNPLHPAVFPSLRKMEAEIVAITLRLFNSKEKGCGSMTSGGTESILMACKAFRDYARTNRGITEPELVVPVTAHAAFDKACAYFCIRLVHVPVDPVSFRAIPEKMAAAITANTIGLVCSAPSYAQGVVDPVEDLAAIAVARGLPLHVDCCLGSFLISFAARAGFPQPRPFDFRVPGVTSISCDTHKYGFSPKGTSLIMYSDPAFRRAQYFTAPEWTGGIYASPTIAGSRAGANIAATWATIMRVGARGYEDAARTILETAKKIREGIAAGKATTSIAVCGEPNLSVVAFAPARGSSINIFNVGDAMKERGWDLNTLQNPAGLHICITFANAHEAAARFLVDLKAAVDDVMTAPPGKFKNGTGAFYGLAASIPDKSLVRQVSFFFLDALYKTGYSEKGSPL